MVQFTSMLIFPAAAIPDPNIRNNRLRDRVSQTLGLFIIASFSMI
jgi:hypothetical protein